MSITTEGLTPAEAAKRAKVSRSMIYTWCAEKRLAHYRFGAEGRRGRIVIDPDDLDKLIAECRKERHPFLEAD